jgi:motility quorum-sensing regulator/GCU-specific mRNA interferase toxin
MTYSAMQGQYELGFSDQDVVDVIQSLTSTNFYKSMPPKHGSYSAWHDVYKSTFKNVQLYIKFQIDNRGEMIISFKAR